MTKTVATSRTIAAQTNFGSIITLQSETRLGIKEDAAIGKTRRSLEMLLSHSENPLRLQRVLLLGSGRACFHFSMEEAQTQIFGTEYAELVFGDLLERLKSKVEETRDSLMADTRQDRPRVLSKWDKIVKEFYEAVWAVFNLDGTVVIGPASEVPWVVDPIDPVLLRPPTESQRERVILNRATITGINVAKGRGDIGQSDLASIPLAVTIRVDDDVREVATELLLAQIDQIRLLRSVVSGEVESRDGAAFRPIGNLDIVYRTDF